MSKVNHPDHYNQLGIECIEVVRHFNFNRGNAIKYIWRAGLKGDAVEDLEKAIWYLRDEIGRLKEKPAVYGPLESAAKAFDAFGKALGQVAEIRYNDGTTKTIEAETENVPAATPPQQETSQQEESSPDTPEKQKEGLRNDSTKRNYGDRSNAIREYLANHGPAASWQIADALGEKRNNVTKALIRMTQQGEIISKRIPSNAGKLYEYSLVQEKIASEPEPPTLSPNAQTVLDTLKEFDCLTPYKHICEAVDLEEIEVTKAIKELKVAKLITSPKIMNYQVVS